MKFQKIIYGFLVIITFSFGIDDFKIRDFNPYIKNKWIGHGVSYAPYRDGESPEKNSITSKENILEDLKILTRHWNLIRLYGTGKQSERVLELIKNNNIPLRVMMGAWISKHQTDEENMKQVNDVIKLANSYPEIIVAVNIGNEIFVDWSWHKVDDMNLVIKYIRKTRMSISQPVTVNDDYNFWNKPHAKRIADEIDFIGLHAYAFWNNVKIDDALEWTKEIYNDIKKRYPNKKIVYSETGWPTSRVYDDSYEGGLIGKGNEKNQKYFYYEYTKWITKNKIISFYFEAFDEKWKGGFDGKNPMNKAEKHWGVYYSNREPKLLFKN